MNYFNRRNFLILFAGFILSSCTSYSYQSYTKIEQLNSATILKKINQVRHSYNVKPLVYNQKLQKAAQSHSKLMAEKGEMSHQLGGSLRQRVTKFGYVGAVGENLAGGHQTLEGAIEGWLASPGHRSTLLSEKFNEFGLAYEKSKNGKYSIYWTFIAGGDFSAWR